MDTNRRQDPKGNYGIVTGPRSGIIVYDVDFKDNGYQEHLKYTQEFGDLDTYTVASGVMEGTTTTLGMIAAITLWSST